jgi:hypothetical protein
MEIPLKKKYRTAQKGRYKSGYGGNNKAAKQKHKLTEREIALHLAQPKKMMVLNAKGKCRMVTVG